MTARLTNKIKAYLRRRRVSKIAQRVKRHNLTYLSYERIRVLEECIDDLERRKVSGIFLEAGLALGGSAIIIATLMSKHRAFHGYDAFGMIPPPSDQNGEKAIHRYDQIRDGASRGIGGDKYYGYQQELYDVVVRNFVAFGLHIDSKRVSLHPGPFDDTVVLPPGEPVALAHIDCDWYASVRVCLERIYPVLVPTGYIIMDDYRDYAGCTKAVHEFLAQHTDILIANGESSLTLQRARR